MLVPLGLYAPPVNLKKTEKPNVLNNIQFPANAKFNVFRTGDFQVTVTKYSSELITLPTLEKTYLYYDKNAQFLGLRCYSYFIFKGKEYGFGNYYYDKIENKFVKYKERTDKRKHLPIWIYNDNKGFHN
jgi:hypothetical protein